MSNVTVQRYRVLKRWLKSPHFRCLYQSGIIDIKAYYQLNSDLTPHPISPIVHWIESGFLEGRNPASWFKTRWYVELNRLDKSVDPLLHFIQLGWAKNLKPNVLFFTRYYKSNLARQNGHSGTVVGKKFSAREFKRDWPLGRNPNPFFDSRFYVKDNELELNPSIDPVTQYIEHGFDQKFHPQAFFDIAFYNESNPRAAEMKIPQLLHYVEYGAGERVTPNRFFDPKYYIQQRKLNISEPADVFGHYLINCNQLDLKPSELFDPAYYAKTYPEYSASHAHPLLHYQEVGVLKQLYPCAEIEHLEHKPLISIVTPVYNTDSIQLKRCIHSVMNQAYPHWELCLVDDASTMPEIKQQLHHYQSIDSRIKVHYLKQNKGISGASRAALKMARGEFVALLDHDDELPLKALYEVVRAINQNAPDVIYSDEELINEEHRHLESIYKPAYNSEFLLSRNYINHFLVVRRSLLRSISAFGDGVDGAQDHDLLLRLAEQTDNIHHIPKSLYRWRVSETSTSANTEQKPYAHEAGMKVIRNAIKRREMNAEVKKGDYSFYYSVHRHTQTTSIVDVIIVASKTLLSAPMQLNNILRKSQFEKARYHLIAHSSAANFKGIKQLAGTQVTVHDLAGMSGVAQKINQIGLQSNADYLAVLGEDVFPIESDWIQKFLSYFQQEEVAMVGGRVFYRPNSEFGDRWFAVPDIENGELDYYKAFLTNSSKALFGHETPQNVSYIDNEFCMIDCRKFKACEGFDVVGFPKYLFDMDLSLEMSSKDQKLIYTSFCSAEHRNSKQLGDGNIPLIEKVKFQLKWRDQLVSGDPYHNMPYLLAQTRLTRKQWLAWYAGVQ